MLLDIVDICMAPRCTDGISGYLHDLIAEHLSSFRELYTDRPLIPKMHYMVHLPTTILKYVRTFTKLMYISNNHHASHTIITLLLQWKTMPLGDQGKFPH